MIPQHLDAMLFVSALAMLLGTCMTSSFAAAADDSVPERTGIVTMRGKPVTLVGTPVKVGDAAPAFSAVANDMSTFNFEPGKGMVWIIASVPSLDTQVCSTETHHFNEAASKLGPNVKILTISMDLPFAQKRWCGAEGVKNLQTISDFRDREFAQRYGVKMKESGLLARAVFVIGTDGKIAYEQIVPDVSNEPDYSAALQAAEKAAGK